MNRYEITGRLTRDAKVQGRGLAARVEATVALKDVVENPEGPGDLIETTYVVVVATGVVAAAIESGGGLGAGSKVYSVGRLAQLEVEKAAGRTERKTRLLATTLLIVQYRSPRPPQPTADEMRAALAPEPDDPWTPRDGS